MTITTHPAHDRQLFRLSGAGREEPSPRADGRGAPARRSGRSPVRSFASSYGGGHAPGTARWPPPQNKYTHARAPPTVRA